MRVVIISLLFILANAEWSIVKEGGSAINSPNSDARMEGRRNAATWCYDNNMYIFGGKGENNRLNDLWKYEIDSNRWLWQPNSPEQLTQRSGSASWNIDGVLWLYGGRNDSKGEHSLDDMWEYHPTSRNWSKHNTDGPGNRYGATTWVHEEKSILYLYGGKSDKSTVHSDIWSFDPKTLKWTNVPYSGNSPGARDDSVAAVSGNTVYLFGGRDPSGSDVPRLSQLDLVSMVWKESPLNTGVSGPVAREDQVMWAHKEKVYIFGGRVGSSIKGDFWSYDIDKKQWVELKTKTPPARWGASFCKERDGNLYMSGGAFQDSTSLHNDVWKYGDHVNIVKDSEKNDNLLTFSVVNAVLSLLTLLFVVGIFIGIFVYCVRLGTRRQLDEDLLDDNPLEIVTIGDNDLSVDTIQL